MASACFFWPVLWLGDKNIYGPPVVGFFIKTFSRNKNPHIASILALWAKGPQEISKKMDRIKGKINVFRKGIFFASTQIWYFSILLDVQMAFVRKIYHFDL